MLMYAVIRINFKQFVDFQLVILDMGCLWIMNNQRYGYNTTELCNRPGNGFHHLSII